MPQSVIEIEHLSKYYRIGAQREPYLSFRDTVVRKAGHLWNILRRKEHVRPAQDDFWALKDVSFSVHQGEAVGIIGRNGAGKSTLLKILSQITPPTEGSITMRGRVASLLEVGTGFHPELTGRENIFLNGTILGMTRAEIRRKFDEIVAFSEIEKFLDTPVKRYSSGMYVRLAFAVAAHLEPEILIIDEVLAVGDAEFQKKCLGKMGKVAAEGRTVLFVSHNMAAVQKLCVAAVLLEKGTVKCIGSSRAVVESYRNTNGEIQTASAIKLDAESQKTACQFIEVCFADRASDSVPQFNLSQPIHIRLSLRCSCVYRGVVVGVLISDTDGLPIFTTHSDDTTPQRHDLRPGINTFECVIDPNILMPGRYSIGLGLVDRRWDLLAMCENVLPFAVTDVPHRHDVLSPRRPGKLLLPYSWKQPDK